MRTYSMLLGLATSALAACSPFSPDLSVNPFSCTPDEMKCPSGYTCQDDPGAGRMVCVEEGGIVVDAPPSGFQCANDSNLETANGADNDSYMRAFSTGVNGSTKKTISFADLAICPEGDKDNYLFMSASANQNITVRVTWDSGMPMSASILGSAGQPLANATADGPLAVKAYIANAPIGTFYALVTAGPTTKNNYKLTITIDP